MPRVRMTGAELKQAKKTVQALLENITRQVDQIPWPVLRDILPVLQEAEREVAQDLAMWLAKAHRPGAVAASEAFTAHQYRTLLLQLRTAEFGAQKKVLGQPGWVQQIEDRTFAALSKGNFAGGTLATQHVMEEVGRLNVTFKGSATPLNLSTVALVKKGDKALVPRFANSAKRYAGNVWEDLKRQLAVGVARAETFDQMTTRIQRLGGPKTVGIAEGMFARHRYVAERLVRTEMINAYNVHHEQAIKSMAKLDDGFSKRWDASLDKRLCSVCNGLHGVIVGTDETFPGGYDKPPAHPNCRCALVAWHSSWGADPTSKETNDPEKQQEAQV